MLLCISLISEISYATVIKQIAYLDFDEEVAIIQQEFLIHSYSSFSACGTKDFGIIQQATIYLGHSASSNCEYIVQLLSASYHANFEDISSNSKENTTVQDSNGNNF